MIETVLQPKLFVPGRQPYLVSRPRLIQALDRGTAPGCKLTLVSAPAGFGKTTALSDWAARCREDIAWLSLDEGDNDPDRFLAYLAAAVQSVLPESGFGETAVALRQSTQPAPLAFAYNTLLNDFAEIASPLILIMDDYHLIESDVVHENLTLLLNHLPPHIHFFLGTRVDPPLGLARLRARFQLNEIRLEALRFQSGEVGKFLKAVADVPLSQDQLEILKEKTEGWAAGLQLAALSLRGREDPRETIANLSGADRYIFDYLAEEVLSLQTPADQQFLMNTAILDRMSGPLCDAVTGSGKGQLWLERLEASNLFLIPMDNQRDWYRYHQLFSGFLRDRLAVLRGDEIGALHHRAAAWFAQEGFTSEAISHYLAAGDHQQAGDLMEQHTRRLFVKGELFTIIRWIQALPDEFVQARPRLCLSLAWSLVIGGGTGWESIIGLVRAAAAGLGAADGDLVQLLAAGTHEAADLLPLCDLAVLQGFLSRQAGDADRAIALFEAALSAHPKDDPLLGALGAGGLGSIYMRMGDAVRAEEAFHQAVQAIQLTGGTFGKVLVLSMLGMTQAWQGRLNRAVRSLRQAMDSAADRKGRPLPFAGQATVGLARLLREQNDLEAALRCAQEGIALSRQVNDLDGLLDGEISLSRILLSAGKEQEAWQALDRAEQVAYQMGDSSCSNRIPAWRLMWALTCGDLEAAARFWTADALASAQSEGCVNTFGELPLLPQARLLLSQRRADEALAITTSLIPDARRDGRGHNLLELLLIQARCHDQMNQSEEAMQAIAQALLLAEPEGYVRTFVDEGPQMAAILRAAAAEGHSPAYVERLLDAFSLAVDGSPVDPLSQRELEVLALISEGLTNQQIAGRLTVALSTVKTHINRIYSKLDTPTRTQAVARARKLRLLQ